MARRKTTFGEVKVGEAFWYPGVGRWWKGSPTVATGCDKGDGGHIPSMPMRPDEMVFLDPPEPDNSIVFDTMI